MNFQFPSHTNCDQNTEEVSLKQFNDWVVPHLNRGRQLTSIFLVLNMVKQNVFIAVFFRQIEAKFIASWGFGHVGPNLWQFSAVLCETKCLWVKGRLSYFLEYTTPLLAGVISPSRLCSILYLQHTHCGESGQLVRLREYKLVKDNVYIRRNVDSKM